MLAVLYASLSALAYGAGDFSGAFASKRNNAALVTFAMQIVSIGALAVVLAFLVDGTLVGTDLWWGALGGLGATVALVTFYKALADGPMSTAASITALIGALVPVIAGLALGEVPSSTTMVGVGLAIPAAILVSVGAVGLGAGAQVVSPRLRSADKDRVARTRVLSIIAGLGFGLFFVALSRTSAEGGLYPLIGARVASIALLAAVLTVGRNWARIGRPDWPTVAITGVLDCAANSFFLIALETGTVTWVAVVVSLYPVATVLLARLVLKERITGVQLAGVALALIALVFVSWGVNDA